MSLCLSKNAQIYTRVLVLLVQLYSKLTLPFSLLETPTHMYLHPSYLTIKLLLTQEACGVLYSIDPGLGLLTAVPCHVLQASIHLHVVNAETQKILQHGRYDRHCYINKYSKMLGGNQSHFRVISMWFLMQF